MSRPARHILAALLALWVLFPHGASASLHREPAGLTATASTHEAIAAVDRGLSLRHSTTLGSPSRGRRLHQDNHGALFQMAEAISYARNNPVNFTDPTGLESVGELLFRKAGEASDAGNTLSAFALGVAYTAWQTFGMEAVSSLEDKRIHGQDIGAGDVAMAALEVGTLGKGGGVVGGGVKLLGKVGRRAAKIAPKSVANAFELAPRVAKQLNDPRLGRLAGKLTPDKLNTLANNPAARRFLDARTGNINVIQEVEGKLLRITTPRDAMKIISVGPIKERNIVNSVANGNFAPLP